MIRNSSAFWTCLDHFKVTKYDLAKFSNDVAHEITNGLHGNPSPFKMLKSYLNIPSGTECGNYLGLDFGGTNIRILLVSLGTNGNYEIIKFKKASLKSEGYNLTSNKTTAENLFDFIATLIEGFAITEDTNLGFTFSYPSKQDSLNSAKLLEWTKEINVSGVVGQNVNQLLKEALIRKGLFNIHPVAVINDTVGTLLTSAYKKKDTTIGSICGTGHNTCYLENQIDPNMIINLESGNYDTLSLGYYDHILDQSSERPGQQKFEKAVSGQYIGELFRLACIDLNKKNILFPIHIVPALKTKHIFKAQDLSLILNSISSGREQLMQWLETVVSNKVSIEDVNIIYILTKTIINRSAHLVAASFLGVIKHIDPGFNRHHSIAIDGALFENIPGYINQVNNFILSNIKDATIFELVFTKEGSAIGAAIAAALANKSHPLKLGSKTD